MAFSASVSEGLPTLCCGDAPLTTELPVREDQRRRWKELLADADLGRDLAKIEGRMETGRHRAFQDHPTVVLALVGR